MPVRKTLAACLGAIALLFALQCSGGGGSPTAPPRVVIIEITENSFNPRRVQINAGDTVRWIHAGADPTHTTQAINGTWDSGPIFSQGGDVFERVFSMAEDGRTFEYRCEAHHDCCSMQGSVRVGPNAPDPRDDY